jgi:hypothetical protein
MAQLDVLDLLRPDGRETGDGAGAGRAADERTAGFQERTPRRALLCSGPMTFLPVVSGVLLMTVSLHATHRRAHCRNQMWSAAEFS